MPNIILNNFCNQKCSYCFALDSMTTEALPVKNQKLSTYIRILHFLKKHGYEDVRLLWGEPMLHPEISRFLMLAHKGWMRTRVFSNLNFPVWFIEERFQNPQCIPQTINANINNKDFYSEEEYKRVIDNLIFFREAGTIMTIGYNIYDLTKPFEDIVEVARKTGISLINLKITNTTIGSPLIVDTGSRAYGEYIFAILKKYHSEFGLVFSCGLSPDIFLPKERDFMTSIGILPRYGCAWFSGKFDIDIDGSIYKCFSTRSLYLGKWITIDNFQSEEALFEIVGITKSDTICRAHTL